MDRVYSDYHANSRFFTTGQSFEIIYYYPYKLDMLYTCFIIDTYDFSHACFYFVDRKQRVIRLFFYLFTLPS